MAEMIDFVKWPKIGRLKRNCIITEKLDGTNAQIYISEDLSPIVCNSGREVPFLCGSRTRWIFPENDNVGFARWAYENAEELLKLGPGHHFGEWWGQGIQRKYGLKEKRFSLFNTSRWLDNQGLPACCSTVPVLYNGPFTTDIVESVLQGLKAGGSVAAPGFPNPEGIVVFHVGANHMFKVTLDSDGIPKSLKGGE